MTRHSIATSQFQRRPSTVAPTIFTTTSNRETNVAAAQASDHPSMASRPLSEEKTPSPQDARTNKRHKRRKNCTVPHLQVEVDLPQEVRMKHLIDIILREEYDKMKDASREHREKFEDAMLNMLDFVDEHAERMAKSSESVANKRRENPANQELRKRELQLEAMVESYRKELQQWEKVDAAVGDMCAEELAEVRCIPGLTDFVDMDELRNTSQEALESFMLQSMHISSVLKKLESRDRETKRRVLQIADMVNKGVSEEIGVGKALVVPTTLAPIT